jgi:hypothetical protein
LPFTVVWICSFINSSLCFVKNKTKHRKRTELKCKNKKQLQMQSTKSGDDKNKKIMVNCGPVAHACDLCYSGGRDQADCALKPGNSWRNPILKKPIKKKGWWGGSRCRLWVQTPALQIYIYREREIDRDPCKNFHT